MNTIQTSNFTQHHGLQRPSIDYYAFRALPYTRFQQLNVIYALFYQLRSLPYCSEDIQIIRHKTLFWIKEIQAAFSGNPTHPVTQDLQKLLKTVPLSQKDCLNMLTAIEMEIDGLLLENDQEIEQYGDKLYGSLYRLLADVLFCRGESGPVLGSIRPINLTHPSNPIPPLAHARALLSFIQPPNNQKIRVLLPENIETQVYTLFDQAITGLKQSNELKPLRVLARLYQHQAQQAMVHLGPLKLLWLSICERLSS